MTADSQPNIVILSHCNIVNLADNAGYDRLYIYVLILYGSTLCCGDKSNERNIILYAKYTVI